MQRGSVSLDTSLVPFTSIYVSEKQAGLRRRRLGKLHSGSPILDWPDIRPGRCCNFMEVAEAMDSCFIVNRGRIYEPHKSRKRGYLPDGFLGGTRFRETFKDLPIQRLSWGWQTGSNPVFHSRSKHIDIRHNFICHALQIIP